MRWNEFCRTRAKPIAFLSVITGGLVASLFVDFGPGAVDLRAYAMPSHT
jgi:hypothetical protein